MGGLARLAEILDKQIKNLRDRIDAMRVGAIATSTNGKDDTAETIARDIETVGQLMVVRSGLPHPVSCRELSQNVSSTIVGGSLVKSE